jgi:hypothetical protein
MAEYDAPPLGRTTPLKREPKDDRAKLLVPLHGRPPHDAVIVLSPPAIGR